MQQNMVVGIGETKHITRYVFNEIRIGCVWCQKRHVSREFGPYGLKADDLEVQQIGLLHQIITCLEAVAAIYGMMSKVGCHCEAAKHNG